MQCLDLSSQQLSPAAVCLIVDNCRQRQSANDSRQLSPAAVCLIVDNCRQWQSAWLSTTVASSTERVNIGDVSVTMKRLAMSIIKFLGSKHYQYELKTRQNLVSTAVSLSAIIALNLAQHSIDTALTVICTCSRISIV